MMTSQSAGNYRELSSECEYLTLAFSPINVPLRSRWRNNGLSADFLGDYVTTFLPTKGGVAAFENPRNEIKLAITYIANELLENAMKYHARDEDVPIKIHLELKSDYITVRVSNATGVAQAERYKAFVENLHQGDAGDLLMKQQEENAKSEASTASCLGLLTMIADYDAQLDWRFEVNPMHSGSMIVTTSAVLPLKDVTGASA